MAVVYRHLIAVPERGYHSFRHYFIPHEGNDHHPLVLRPSALRIYSVVLIVVKLAMTGFLYTVYPTEAFFAELTAGRVLTLMNRSRAEDGLAPLRMNPRLTEAATKKARDLLALGYFDHTSPAGKKFWVWIQEAGYRYRTAGENLAMDFTSAETVHRAFMASPSHRSNILKPTYVDVGLAVLRGTMNGRPTMVLVQEFGTPLAAAAAERAAPARTAPAPPIARSTAGPVVRSAASEAPRYAGVFVASSVPAYTLLAGSSVTAWVEFRNTGTAIWTNTGERFAALNVSDPPGRASDFRAPDWPAAYRPAVLENARVAPGEVGRFTFTLAAPQTAGQYEERFAVVIEHAAWVEGASIALPIVVTAPAMATIEPAAAPAAPEPAEQAVPVSEEPDAAATTEPLVVVSSGADWTRTFTEWALRFFWAFGLFLGASLLLHLAVTVRYRHHVVLQTMLVLGLTAFLLATKFHFAERIARTLIT